MNISHVNSDNVFTWIHMTKCSCEDIACVVFLTNIPELPPFLGPNYLPLEHAKICAKIHFLRYAVKSHIYYVRVSNIYDLTVNLWLHILLSIRIQNLLLKIWKFKGTNKKCFAQWDVWTSVSWCYQRKWIFGCNINDVTLQH